VLAAHVTALCAELAGDPAATPQAGDDAAAAPVAALPLQGREATLAGMVNRVRRLYTKDGRPFCAAEVEDLSGTCEVTVWSELFERTQDLWIEGNILLLEVRARERNGRLQVAVQQVERYEPEQLGGFHPPEWLVKEAGNGKREAGPSAEPRTENAEPGRAGDGGRDAKAQLPVAPSDERRATSDQSRAPTPESRDASVAVATRSLRIELRETEDEAADRERLRALLDALRAFPGDDAVQLTIHTLDGGTQTAALPPARSCPELTARLREALGEAGTVGEAASNGG